MSSPYNKISLVYNKLFKYYQKFEKLDYINHNLTKMVKIEYD